jgi:hypothetical protein
VIGVDDRVIRRGQRRTELADERDALVDELGAERDEALVPDVEGRELVDCESTGSSALEQRVALLEHALVVGHDAREARRALHEQLIEQAAAHRGLAPHDREVFGSEEHAVRVPRQLARLHR